MSHKKTALITGASSGIGEAFARALAETSDQLVLVARREDRLQQLAEEIRRQGVEVHIVAADLATTIGQGLLVDTIRQKGPLSYLVNNAGFTTTDPIADADPIAEAEMVALHISAVLSATRAAIAGMREQGGGAIINVASLVAIMPMGTLAVYGGTKAFLQNYSEAVAHEEKDNNIKVQCLCPGYTRTEFHSTEAFEAFDASAIPDEFWQTSEHVVEESLAGLVGGATTLIPGDNNRQLVNSYRQKKWKTV